MDQEKLMGYYGTTHNEDGTIDKIVVCPFTEDGTPRVLLAKNRDDLISKAVEIHKEEIEEFLKNNPDLTIFDIKVGICSYEYE